VVVAEHWSSEKNLLNLLFWGKKDKKGKKEKKKKKHCRPADVASLQCHPLPRCWHASIVVAMRGFIQTRLLPCHTSAPLFMHAVCTALITPPRVSHITFKTQRSIQPRPANLLRPTDSGTEGVGHRQRVKGVVGGAKKARAHIHAQACGGTVAAQANACGKSGWEAILNSITRPFLSLVSLSLVELSQLLPCVIFFYLVFFGHITATGYYVPSALPIIETPWAP
jgi:hypothetical protein